MGMDLDLAVSDPGSTFSETYQASFAARVAAARDVLGAAGVTLPEPVPLPAGLERRIGLGSYSSANVLCGAVHDFLDHLRKHGTLPGLPVPERPLAELPECLRPLQWADHASFPHAALFVPVAFDPPLTATAEGETFRVLSSVHALAALRVVSALSWLNDENMWDWQDVLPEMPGEPFRGYHLMSGGFPEYPDIWGVEHMIEALRASVKYRVPLTVS